MLLLRNKIARTTVLTVLVVLTTGALYLATGPQLGVGLPSNSQSTTVTKKSDLEDIELPDVTPDISQFGLEIPSLSIKAPVIPEVDGLNERLYHVITAKLGVAQLKGSSYPDQPGNVYLFGHSSFWLNYPGEYKQLLRPLDQLEKGQGFTIYYKGAAYEYTVTANKIVAEDDFSVLDPTPEDTKDFTATVQTSWPPGTAQKRLVVFGVRTTTEKNTE